MSLVGFLPKQSVPVALSRVSGFNPIRSRYLSSVTVYFRCFLLCHWFHGSCRLRRNSHLLSFPTRDGCSGSDSQLSQTTAPGAERTGQGMAQSVLTGLKHGLLDGNVYFSRRALCLSAASFPISLMIGYGKDLGSKQVKLGVGPVAPLLSVALRLQHGI